MFQVRKASENCNLLKKMITDNYYMESNKFFNGEVSIFAGWIKTVIDHQTIIQNNIFNLDIPIIVLYSSNSLLDYEFDGENHKNSDIVLDTKSISKYVENLTLPEKLTKKPIKNANHDILSSYNYEVVNEAITVLLEWLKING